MAALGSGRTLILDSKGWSYAKDGWETVFQTVNGNCTAPRNVAAQSRNIAFLTRLWLGVCGKRIVDINENLTLRTHICIWDVFFPSISLYTLVCYCLMV